MLAKQHQPIDTRHIQPVRCFSTKPRGSITPTPLRSASIPQDPPNWRRSRRNRRSSRLLRTHTLQSPHNRPLSRLLLCCRGPVDNRSPRTRITRFTAVARPASTGSRRWRRSSYWLLWPANGGCPRLRSSGRRRTARLGLLDHVCEVTCSSTGRQ